MHVIPSCERPSFWATDASSHRGNARLEPHIGNAGESVAGILTEKSLVHVFLVRSSDVSERLRRFFQETLLGSPAGFGLAWRAGGNGTLMTPDLGRILPCFGHQLTCAPSNTLAPHSRLRCNVHSLRPCDRWPGRSDAAACMHSTCFLQSPHSYQDESPYIAAFADVLSTDVDEAIRERRTAARVALAAVDSAVFEPLTYHTTPLPYTNPACRAALTCTTNANVVKAA